MRNRPALLRSIVAAWLVAIVIGLATLDRFSLTAGVDGTPPATWPSESGLVRENDALTLVMAVHPHCPCTRASIGELQTLMAKSQGRLKSIVLFMREPGFDDNWTQSDLWQSAATIPGVTALIDDGRETRLFGAATSGQTMVYGVDGRLLFSGGITSARGHFGDNPGVDQIAALLDKPMPRRVGRTLVYGCELFGPRRSLAAARQINGGSPSECPLRARRANNDALAASN